MSLSRRKSRSTYNTIFGLLLSSHDNHPHLESNIRSKKFLLSKGIEIAEDYYHIGKHDWANMWISAIQEMGKG